jgi:serine/threonine protein kinase
VANLFLGDSLSDIGIEAKKMQYPNKINNLVAKFCRLEYTEELDAEMLMMERIQAIDYRAYEVEIKELWFEVFEDELKKLHKEGFIHKDLKRP